MQIHLGEAQQSNKNVLKSASENSHLLINEKNVHSTWSDEVLFSDDCETDKLSVWENKTK